MIRLAAVLALMAMPVSAETYTFGGASIEWTGREVIFRNGLTDAHDFPADFHRDMTQGFTVRVVIMQGGGLAPDMMMVIPPAGYVAVPEVVTVEEHEQGVIVVFREGLS
jgi:hypothetical protein